LSLGTTTLLLRFPTSFSTRRKEIAVATSVPGEFEAQLINLLPKMRIWALALTKNKSAADDLVQDVATKALAKRTSFELGTNFVAWIHRIMVNHFISSMRERHEFVGTEEMPDVSMAAEQPAKVDLDRLSVGFDRLLDYQKEVVRQIVIEQRSYEDVSKSTGCAIGTLKSRLHRARLVLRTRLDGEERFAA
jgi:RNA polymerase sigma-70 factor, ECF subfamily